MPADEGDALHAAALAAAAAVPGAPFVEIGSYCGRSTIWLGAAARDVGHRGVRRRPPPRLGGEPGRLGAPRPDRRRRRAPGGWTRCRSSARTIHDAGLEDHVVAVVGRSPVVARHWSTPAALVFIDGGHGVEPARADYAGWAPHVAVGGTLAIHDVFPDPADGGRPPYEEIFVPALDERPLPPGVGHRLAAHPRAASTDAGGRAAQLGRAGSRPAAMLGTDAAIARRPRSTCALAAAALLVVGLVVVRGRRGDLRVRRSSPAASTRPAARRGGSRDRGSS